LNLLFFCNIEKRNKKVEEYDIECSVRPEEVPVIPANNFLMRKIESEKEENIRETENAREELKNSSGSYERRTRNIPISRSGRKIKGRGFRVSLYSSLEYSIKSIQSSKLV
jgi:hypothetical protein